nr:MAG TPA: nuclear pore complex protein [Caudoviricetes sp.]
MYDRMPPKLPFYWNSVIPATLDTALTFDEMQSKIVWTVNKILENQYLTVPYLISLGTEYTTTSISIKGILFQNYTPLQVDKEFVINGMKDGTYYINVFNDAANTEAGKPPVQSNDLLFLSTDYMPKNCTSLYVFDILNGNIVGNSIRYNDLYTEMHNADPNAHQALFEAVYNKIEEESDGLHNEIVTETNRAKQAEQQLQDNIDNESTARQQADTTLQNNINAEKTARENADTTLQNSINAEKTAREQADTALRNSLDEEIGDRINGEDTINNKIDTHIANKNNPHNVTADQIGNVVKTINNLVNNITVNGSRGTSITNSSNTITVIGSMIDTPSDTNLDNATDVGIYSLSATTQYTSSYTGLPSKSGWLYMLVYQVGTAKKQIIYNADGTVYRRENAASNWLELNYGGGGGTAGVSSINSLTGEITLNGDQGVRITNTGNAIHVSGQYYVLSQNTSINGTLRPGITAAGNYAFTNTPQNKSVMYVITVDYKSNEYIYAQYAVCFDYSIYRRLSNADGSKVTEWYYNGVTAINDTKGSIIFEARNGASISKSGNTFTVLGPIARSPNFSLNTNNSVGIFSFDYDSSPVGMPTEATNAYVMLQVMTDGTNSIESYTQLVIDKDDGKMFTRTKNNNGSQATAWKLSSYSPALDNQTITLDSLSPNLGIQNLTLQLEHYRGVTFKAKFYVPFAVSNSNSPLTEIALWSLPEGWAFDEDQYIPLYIRSVSSGASSFGYIQCSNNAMQLIIGGTGQSIPAGWVVRFCNSDVYLVKSGA